MKTIFLNLVAKKKAVEDTEARKPVPVKVFSPYTHRDTTTCLLALAPPPPIL